MFLQLKKPCEMSESELFFFFHCLLYLPKVSYKPRLPGRARPRSGADTVQQTFCLPETFIIQFADICKC